MPLDPTIALQVKNPPLESPINQMAKIYEIKQAQQANELNRLKMDEYTRGVQEQEQFKNQLRGAGTDEEAIRNAFYNKGDVKGYSDYLKSRGEIKKNEAETNKAHLEATHSKLNLIGQAFGHVRSNPTAENALMALDYLAKNNVIDAAQLEKEKADILANPDPAHIKQLADQGFTAALSAKDQLPKIESQDLGGKSRFLNINPVTGMATPIEGSEATKTATPGDILSASTTRRGQDLINSRDLQKIEIEKGKMSPEYITMKARMEQQGKDRAKFEAAAPEAISKAEEAVRKIDELVGTEPTKNAEGKIIPGSKPHPGFQAAVGLGFPGITYVPGTSAADFDARLKEIQGGAFLQAYETLKGGGSITEVEGAKATQAITRMSKAQSETEFKTAAREFQNILRKAVDRSKAKLGNAGAPAAASATPDVDSTNPLLQ